MTPPTITRAGVDDAGTIAALFAQYCAFYRSDVTTEAAGDFVRTRLENGDAVVHFATVDGQPAGFVLLYPKYSSTTLSRDWILNDLFVSPDFRRRGIATALMNAATAHASGPEGFGTKVALKTQVDNDKARALYEREGWRLDTKFVTYVFDLNENRAGGGE